MYANGSKIKCVAKGKTAEFLNGIKKDEMCVAIVGSLVTKIGKDDFDNYFVEIKEFYPMYEDKKHKKLDYRNAEVELGLDKIEKIGEENQYK